MKDRRKTKRWCPDCREHYKRKSLEQGLSLSPHCEVCWPGITDANIEAWMVFMSASKDPWGINPMGIWAVMQAFDIENQKDCMEKVLFLASESQDESK